MPVQWTAEADQRLLLAILDVTKVNPQQIAAHWASKYGTKEPDNKQPTARAITEHIRKLQGKVGGGGASNSGTPTKANGTPRAARTQGKTSTPKTPTGNRKRKHDDMDDEEEDDSDPDLANMGQEVKSRASIGRRSKSVPKKYEESDIEELDDQDEDEKDEQGIIKLENNEDFFNSMINFDGAAEDADYVNVKPLGIQRGLRRGHAAAQKPQNHAAIELESESDISDFAETFLV